MDCSPPGSSVYGILQARILKWVQFSSVQFSHWVMSDSLQTHGLQHARPPCPSPTPRVYPYSCPLSWWCHPTISSSAVPFSSCLSLSHCRSFSLQWVAIPFSRESSRPRDWTWISCIADSLPSEPPGKPKSVPVFYIICKYFLPINRLSFFKKPFLLKSKGFRTSLVVQWLRICLPMQGMQVWSLVKELESHIP